MTDLACAAFKTLDSRLRFLSVNVLRTCLDIKTFWIACGSGISFRLEVMISLPRLTRSAMILGLTPSSSRPIPTQSSPSRVITSASLPHVTSGATAGTPLTRTSTGSPGIALARCETTAPDTAPRTVTSAGWLELPEAGLLEGCELGEGICRLCPTRSASLVSALTRRKSATLTLNCRAMLESVSPGLTRYVAAIASETISRAAQQSVSKNFIGPSLRRSQFVVCVTVSHLLSQLT